MFINVENTPNPETLKFIPECEIKVDKSYLFKKGDQIESAELVNQLFEVEGVESILIDREFISITKNKEISWDILKTILTSSIGTYLDKNDNVIFIDKTSKNETNKKNLAPIEIKICELLETKVKPVVASHGGEISFHSFEKGTVYLELKGSCSGCPSSTATLKMGIENMLKHYHPEIQEVVEVNS